MRDQYDAFVEILADEALTRGDDQAIAAFKEARTLRRFQGKIFESDKVITDILTNPDLTPETAVNKLIGSANLNSKSQAGDLAKKLIDTGLEQNSEVRDALKHGLIHRVLTRGQEAQRVTKDGTAFLSPAKLNSQLKLLLGKNRSLAETVFDADELAALDDIQKTMNLIASKQPGAVNASNTFEKLAQLLNRIPALGAIPGVRALPQAVADAQNGRKALELTAQAIADIDKVTKTTGVLSGVGTATGVNASIKGSSNN
jgi:predicted transcriptional regulator